MHPPERVENFTPETRKVENWVVRFLGGLKFGLTILALVIVASSVGEFLPAEVENNLAFELVFRTWWYRLLLLLLATNLVLNTYITYVEQTFPQFLPTFRRGRDQFKDLDILRREKFDSAKPGDSEGLMKGLASAFSARGYRTFYDAKGVYAHRGLIARFGSTLTHLGLITILIGALAESFLKVQGYVQMLEGETTSGYYPGGDDMDQPPTHDLGFSIKCEDFDFIRYPGSDTPKVFKTSATFSGASDEPVTDFIRVNHKVAYGGWVFHQNNWLDPDRHPPLGQLNRYFVELTRRDGGEERLYTFETYVTAGRREITPLPGHDDLFFSSEFDRTGRGVIWSVASKEKILTRGDESLLGNWSIEMVDFYPDLALDENEQPFNRSNEFANPAALIEISSDNTIMRREWVSFKITEPFNPATATPFDFLMIDYKILPERGLSSAASPSVSLASLPSMIAKPAGEGRASAESRRGQTVVTIAFRNPQTGRASGMKYELAQGLTVPLFQESNTKFDIAGDYAIRAFRRVPAMITVLEISKNPGIPVVWVGAIFASFGPVLAFFVSRRRVWAHIDWDAKKLVVGGASRYSREALEDEIGEVLAEWSRSPGVKLRPPLAGPRKIERDRISIDW